MNKTKPNSKWQSIEGRFNLSGVQYSDWLLVCVRLKPGTIVRLVGEPTNKYDNRAIRVETKECIKLGYVPAKSIQQSELWNSKSRGYKCIGVITQFNKKNPTWCAITVQALRCKTVKLTDKDYTEIPFDN